MQGALFIMSDSGGLQEEAPWLGKPVLLLRSCTERPEAVSSGAVSLVGTDEDRIYEHAFELIHNPARYTQMAQARNPYGDGTASIQIAQILSEQI
jgi:UDP-N-acetylglucosamine 2-epimerase (non-hydrolysing)